MSVNPTITATIVGASGYGGGELLRLLIGHPQVTVTQATSRQYAGLPVSVVHANLRKQTDLKFSKLENTRQSDVIFLCLPNGVSQEKIAWARERADKIIDLGADFRLHDKTMYAQWYDEHQQPDFLNKFTYGLAELHRDELRAANYVACGGCEATCSILTLYPLYKHELIKPEQTIIDAKLGSSAAGNSPSNASHHPERAGVVRSYQATDHRHTAEIEQELGQFMSNTRVHVSATAIEMVRGILVTAHAFLTENLPENELWSIYQDTYAEEPFIRLVNDKIGNYRFPEPKLLQGTNFCDIGLQKAADSNRVVVVGAIDNLTKGTAGQAVQAMNIMYEFAETAGLEFTGLHPI